MPSWIPDAEHNSWGHQSIPFPEAEDIREAPFHGCHPLPGPCYSFTTQDFILDFSKHGQSTLRATWLHPKVLGLMAFGRCEAGSLARMPTLRDSQPSGSTPTRWGAGVGDRISRTKHINGQELAMRWRSGEADTLSLRQSVTQGWPGSTIKVLDFPN